MRRPDELGGTGKVAPGPGRGVEGGEVGVPPLAPGERRLRLGRRRARRRAPLSFRAWLRVSVRVRLRVRVRVRVRDRRDATIPRLDPRLTPLARTQRPSK